MFQLRNLFNRTPAPAPEPLPEVKSRSAAGPRGRAATANGRIRSIMQAAQTGRLEASWGTTPHTADLYITQNWKTIVARSRDASDSNEHAIKFLTLVQDNVAGARGFRFRADVRDPQGRVDMVASNAIEAEFKRFSREGNFEVTGTQSRTDFERLWCKQLATDGESIAAIVYGPDAGPYGFGLQMIDPVMLDPAHNEVLTPGGNYIRHGIEFTRLGRPVRYYFREYEENGSGWVTYSGQKYNVIDARFIIHDFLPEKVGQKRGLPWMRAALWRMRMLKGYEDAAVTNARVGASKMGFFRDPDGEALEEDEIPMDAEPGTFQNIGGLEFTSFDPQYPSGEFAQFVQRCLMSMASGLRVSYHTVASDLSGVNYSSARIGMLDEREVWTALQEHVITRLCMRVYSEWIDFCLLADRITINGKPLKLERANLYKEAGMFSGRRWQWVDPQSEITAYEKSVNLGIKSRQSIIRESEQADPWDVWDEIKEERAELEKRDIPLNDPAQTAQAMLAQAEAGRGGKTAEPSSATTTPADPTAKDGKSAAQSAAADGDLQGAALNGAQVTALIELAASVAEGRLPLETAKAMANAAFPLITDEQIDQIFEPLLGFAPTPPPEPATAPPTSKE